MKIDGKQLVEGKLYLWNVAQQAATGKDLHSVYFVTEKLHPAGIPTPDKVYEVVFTAPNDRAVNAWYLVEKDVESEKLGIPEGEVVETIAESVSGGGDLQINVEDELKLGEMLS